jgi:orotidine-5'-phosphate decarboxylase
MKAIGENLFWDGKFDDIPNTIAGASLGLEPLSPKFFNVHASADFEAVREAVKNKGTSKVLAVTLLTSIHPVRCEMMFGQSVRAVVKKWALSAVVEGHADGLICSPADLGWINEEEKLVGVPKMTPGIRPEFSQKGDQKRVMTPAEAVRAGSTWLVIGRPITGYPEGPAVAVDRIVEELAAVG